MSASAETSASTAASTATAQPRKTAQYKVVNRKKRDMRMPKLWDVRDLCEVIDSHKDRTVFRWLEGGTEKSMDYASFSDMIRRCAAGFTKLGLVGEKVVIIGETSPEWLCTYIGALAAGCVIVPMDKELNFDEVRKFFDMIDVRCVVYGKSLNEKMLGAVNSDSNVAYFVPIVPAYDVGVSPKVTAFADLLATGETLITETGYDYPVVRNRETLAEMLFTSGTTGTSKCVMLCQKNIFAAVNAAVETVCFDPDDVVVSVLPPHHTYELMCLLGEMVYGEQICINDSLRRVMKNFQYFKPTALVLVPLFINTMYKKIWTEAQKSRKDFWLRTAIATSKTFKSIGIDARGPMFRSVRDAFGGRLDHIICGGAKLNPDLIAAFEDFGISIFEGCGITECSPLTCVTPYYARKYGSVGPAVPCCKVRIDVAPDAEPGEHGYPEGEIQVKGDNVMLGYYNNPEANEQAFTADGWYRTGDVGYMDEDGYVSITGRMKSVIVLENGKNVFPEEIEEYLSDVPTIAECVVVGRRAAEGDDVILTAVVFPNVNEFPKGATDELMTESIRQSINRLNRSLPSYKQIKALELRKTEFEKTTSKKIKRHLVH